MNQLMAGKQILRENIPSSSACGPDLQGTYEVFLSFRGKDTRHGFTDHLYHNLVGAGVDTFRDDNELRVGEEIGPELLKAIKDSKILIPIFSKNYAESKWCLREFAQMVECMENWGQKIFPIFYDVEPYEVQHYERGSYNKAFVKYENDSSLDQKKVEEWKRALAIVGELKGLELKKETNGLEGGFVKTVVQKILSKLKKNDMYLPETLVGIEGHIEKLKGLLKCESNGVRIIGILGMSGLGKTTIAKAIYNQLHEFFDSHCFIEDVRGELQRVGLLNLQKQLVLMIVNREIPEIRNVDEGIGKIKDAVRRRKVFLVLDNVDDKFQIEKLAVNHSWYGDGSRIIITTTNQEVLLAIKVHCEGDGNFDVYENYEPPLMGGKDALKLFSKCAFKRDSPPEDYLELAKEVMSHAGGLPLVLEALGSLLSIERDKVCWEDKLKKLREMPPREVVERLRISYDALDLVQKQIFLDIACFFIGWHKSNPVYMWDACGFHPSEGIKALIRRCLIKVTRNGEILWMHDRFQELGKQIVNENFADPWERSRLWDHNEALETLVKYPGLKKAEAVRFKFKKPNLFDSRGAPSNPLSRRIRVMKSYVEKNWEYTYPRLAGQDFAMLPKLRYLSIANADLVGDFKGVHSKLRWIQWQGCSGNSMPSNLYLKNIVILDLSMSRINHKWKWWTEIKMAEKLKVLNLSHCNHLGRVPHLSNFASLERLDLRKCKSLCRLDGLEQLSSLTYLNVSECVALKTLPDLSKMRKLRRLDIYLCSELTAVQGLEKLESLEHLDVSHCRCLQKLPNLSNLQNLTSFNASFCRELTETRGLDGLRSLERCHMIECPSLGRFPDLSNCKKLRSLEKRFSKVSEVQGLESLENLEIWSTECLDKIPDLSQLRRLRQLTISSCDNLIEIQGLPGLESLESFSLCACSSINRVTKFSNLKRLKYLFIFKCKELTEICGVEELESLRRLDIRNCKSIKNLPDLSNLKNLEDINVSGCEKLTEIRGLEQLISLTMLVIAGCDSLDKNLPTLPNTTIIRELDQWEQMRKEELDSILRESLIYK